MYEIFEQLLQKYGVTSYKVAKEAGVTQTALSNWKSGRSTPTIKTLQKIADYFGVTVDYLMTGKEEVPSEPQLTSKDKRDIEKDLESIMEKLNNQEEGPASFGGQDIPEDDRELFAAQLEAMLVRLKKINKELYNPNKNKK
ncbi:transcriptional regulator [Blautia sp. An249]|uniref:helix-turn-helix domain-containing protein n=1 Tax=Blautia sp. An249 TaxID=1965603 RepID=UPI000B376E10|nr:helix-turn-helix transcriptional regulator [Blautia sp. An249]OUO75187.1 transcriptional regulator [Blautia sp. An249]